MRITTILGSPKMNDKTVAALELTEKKLRLLKHDITRFNLNEYEINGCCGCYSCMQSKETPGCIINDDMNNILSNLISADAVILSSPLYFYGLSSQIKPLVDRTLCLSNKPFLDGKNIAGLLTCRGQEEGNADLVKEFFRRTFDGERGGIFHTRLIGTYVIPHSASDYFSERAELITSELVKILAANFHS